MKLLRILALVVAFVLVFGIAISLDNYVPTADQTPSYPDHSTSCPPTVETELPSLKGKTIVNFGDSIFGNFKAPNDISSYLSNSTRATVYNVGFGGCRMARHSIEQYDSFSMYNLSSAVTTGDWSLQDSTMARTDWTPHNTYARNLARLQSIDFNAVDIITIAYGTNDFTGKIPLSSADPYDTATFKGALRKSIETIQSAYPHIEIILCTQTYRFWMDEENDFAYLYDSNTHEVKGQKLTDFVQATKDVAAEYDLLCIDNYYNSGIGYDNKGECFSKTDGTHPNETGRQMIANYMASVLLEKYK